jgi:hypothetical protein
MSMLYEKVDAKEKDLEFSYSPEVDEHLGGLTEEYFF